MGFRVYGLGFRVVEFRDIIPLYWRIKRKGKWKVTWKLGEYRGFGNLI